MLTTHKKTPKKLTQNKPQTKNSKRSDALLDPKILLQRNRMHNTYRQWRIFTLKKRWDASKNYKFKQNVLRKWHRHFLNVMQSQWRLIVRANIHFAYKQYLKCWKFWQQGIYSKRKKQKQIELAGKLGK